MADSSGERCSFTFDPAEWEATAGMSSPLTQDLLEDGEIWECPHETSGDADRCLFHRPVADKDPDAVRQAFLDKIDERGAEPKQFIGARFGTLDLAHEIVECLDNHMIDLRHARFEKETRWWYTIVRQPIAFSGARFLTQQSFTETVFASEVYCHKTRFEARVQFIETDFEAGLWAYKSRFTEANFHNATFGGPVDLSESSFEDAHFRATEFTTTVRFTRATFEQASFSGAHFGERLYLDEVTVPDGVSIQKATVDELVSFEDLVLAEGTCCIDLSETVIPDGRLYLPDDGILVYNLTDATLGDVDLADDDPPKDLFDHHRFLHTTFDGFDFGNYRPVLHNANWRLHDVVTVPKLDPRASPPSDGDLESTYLKAKNGANEIGDTKAAAEFFRQEMLARRDQYLPVARDGSEDLQTRTTAVGRWAANTLLNVTAGYGERPSRVIGVSVGIILGFASVFAMVQPEPLYDSPLGYFVLSLQSFITLVLGGAEDVGGPWIRLLAQIEGFVGAFLIALFVFTLTRSIHR